MALKDTQNRTIILPIEEEDYAEFVLEPLRAREIIDQNYRDHPELFPSDFGHGYSLNGFTRMSRKMNLQMRRILVCGHSYQIRPSYILSYCRGKASEVSKALFLLRFGVPFWALAFVFGRDPMYWYRLFISFSPHSLVGTTVRFSEDLPLDLVADEQHIRLRGVKAYVATTIVKDCILGAEVCPKADLEGLKEAYGVFEQEALDLCPDYQPNTVNTDGWSATQAAWKSLFPGIEIIECFLHAYLKIRDRATKLMTGFFFPLAEKVWHCYRAESKAQMSQRIRRVAEWTLENVPQSPMKENVLKLCKKKNRWLKHLAFPNAHRTSNQLDRVMRFMKKHALSSQMFHGSIKSTTKNYRAFALLYNFSPSSPGVARIDPELNSPAARLNGFVYHSDWLQNLLISTSLGGFFHQHKA